MPLEFRRTNAISVVPSVVTRCCDAQGADAVVYRKNAMSPPVVVAALIVRDVPAAEFVALMPSSVVPRRRTRCCDAQGAGAVVLRKNAICTARRVAALIVREVPAFSQKCHLLRTRRCTRCCDAQGAGAVVFSHKCHFCHPSW